jgi:hypothetical protein
LDLGDPPFPLHQLAVHDGDLASRTPEVDEPELHPEPESFPKPDRFGLSLLFRLLTVHIISTYQVNNSASLTTVLQKVKDQATELKC